MTTDKFEMNLLYKSKESLIVLIQALARGFLVRRFIQQRGEHFKRNLPRIVKIQSWWRMVQQRDAYQKRKNFFVDNERAIVKIQSFVRMWLQRKKFVERNLFFQTNVSLIHSFLFEFRKMSFKTFCWITLDCLISLGGKFLKIQATNICNNS